MKKLIFVIDYYVSSSMPKTNTSIRVFYNRIASIYQLIDFFLKKEKVRLVNEINQEAKGRLLDIGVGSGTHLAFYKNHHVFGIDLSENMLRTASLQRQYTEITLTQMDGELLDFPNNSFDYVLMAHVLSVTSNPEKMISEAQRVLKPNGKLYILNHNTPNNLLKHIDKKFQFFAKWFYFSSYFKIINIKELKKFQLINERKIDLFNYKKIFVYQK